MQLLIQYAMTFVGTPYRWGGDDPIAGFDCSGFVQDVLKFAGEDPPGDQSAQALFDHLALNGKYGVWGPGALVFYGADTKHVTHVAFCVDNYRCLHAGGGGSSVQSLEDAIKQNAYIKGTLIRYRQDIVAVIKPLYNRIGLT